MQNIHVNRYNHYVGYRGHGYLGWVEPEDRSWVLFITKDSTPVLMLKIENEDGPQLEDGTAEYVYMEANALIDGSGDEVAPEALHALGLRTRGFDVSPDVKEAWEERQSPEVTPLTSGDLHKMAGGVKIE